MHMIIQLVKVVRLETGEELSRASISSPPAKPVTAGAAGAPSAAISGSAKPIEMGGAVELPSAIPSFIEACGKLAGEAAARGDLEQAREILERAARAATTYSH